MSRHTGFASLPLHGGRAPPWLFGQGRRSRRAPHEVAGWCELLGRDPQPLVYASRTAAKVDSAASEWCVVQ